MQYVVSCLWFLFNAKTWLFISYCRRRSLLNVPPTFSDEIVVFRLARIT